MMHILMLVGFYIWIYGAALSLQYTVRKNKSYSGLDSLFLACLLCWPAVLVMDYYYSKGKRFYRLCNKLISGN